MRKLIIYHFEDNDGVCSCALIKNELVNSGEKEIDLLGSNYASLDKLMQDNDFDEYFGKYDRVYMTDVSFNDWTYMKKLHDKFGENFIWFDHHAPIIADSHKYGFDDAPGYRDTTMSAILCVYHYYAGEEYDWDTAPTLLRLLSAWDCWSWVREGIGEEFIRAFNAGVTAISELSVNYFFDNIGAFLMPGSQSKWYHYPTDGEPYVRNFIEKFLVTGTDIIRRQDRAAEVLVLDYGEQGWKVDGEENAVMIVTSGPTNSQMFKCVKDKLEHGICFKHTKEGKWLVSLYNTRNDITFDCGAYLRKKYGGGGHVGAAGCTLDNEQFYKVIKEKSL